ncbi:MAG: Bax inhibitor-1/YccA family protein [Betaproteobacteria bacterium]|nr:Bax inhibitor-1/YccA family protein [Betaproteobacteria bacterium]
MGGELLRGGAWQQGQEVGEAQQRVLRNTYLLLGVSMIPTLIGALFGVYTGFNLMAIGSPWIGLLLFFGIAYGLMFAVSRTKDSGMGVVFLLIFTLFMGVALSGLLQFALGRFSNGGQLIAMAAGGTGAIFFTLSGIAATTRRDFSHWGKFLFVGLVVVFLAIIANLFFQIPALSLAISAAILLLFCGYLLYDINRIVHGGETNYIMATLSVYLDIYNIFVSLLRLLMALAGED